MALIPIDTLDDPADAGRLRMSDDVRVVDNRDGTVLHQPPGCATLPERLERQIREYGDPGFQVSFEYPDSIDPLKSGKYQFTLSKLTDGER